MKHKKSSNKLLLIILILLVALLAFIFSSKITGMFLLQDEDSLYTMRGLSTSGGGKIGGDTYILDVAVGQELSGAIEGQKYNLCLGVMCAYNEPVYDISLRGNLTYNSGNPVETGSRITAKLSYQDYSKSIVTQVIGDGQFSVEFDDIPDSVIDKEFIIEIFVEGKIDAVYSCRHQIETVEDVTKHICTKL